MISIRRKRNNRAKKPLTQDKLMTKLVCDSGATKAEWCLLNNGKRKTFFTQGISPYFLNVEQIRDLLRKDLQPKLKNIKVDEIFYYGTGCVNPANARLVKKRSSWFLQLQKK